MIPTSTARPRPRSNARWNVTRFVSATLAATLVLELGCPGIERVARADGAAASTQTVEDLARQAYQQTAAGKYADAIASYMKAYEISKAGAILYNIATICDRKLHERTLAMEYFRRYLQAPDAEPDFARKATERLSALKAEAAAEDKARAATPMPAPPPPVAPPPVPSSEPTTAERGSGDGTALRVTGIIVGALGLGAVGAGFGLGALAKSKYDNPYCTANSCSSSAGISADQQAVTFATISTASVIGGVALLATGITFLVVAPHGTTQVGSLTIGPEVTLAGGGLGVHGTF